MIIRTAQFVALHVADEEACIAHAFRARVGLGGTDEVLGAVDSDRLAAGPDWAGDAQRAVAEAAPDVEHARARGILAALERRIAVLRQAVHDQVLEAMELVEQHRVPGFDDDAIAVVHRAPPAGG